MERTHPARISKSNVIRRQGCLRFARRMRSLHAGAATFLFLLPFDGFRAKLRARWIAFLFRAFPAAISKKDLKQA
jgi:hypothetical protein